MHMLGTHTDIYVHIYTHSTYTSTVIPLVHPLHAHGTEAEYVMRHINGWKDGYTRIYLNAWHVYMHACMCTSDEFF